MSDRLSVIIPSVSPTALGYDAFIGPYANMRYQLLRGFVRAVTNHFEVIDIPSDLALFVSTASRSLRLSFTYLSIDRHLYIYIDRPNYSFFNVLFVEL